MRADIFCRVIDNYGDIGVCWRLARRLAHGFGWQVRLWVDNLESFAKIQPEVRTDAPRQNVNGIDIEHWRDDVDTTLPPGEVVIEAFACDPPESYIDAMRGAQSIWINLEYLSAEPWVESCHGMPSQRPDDLRKFFFFPGFTPATGGLLREPGLSDERDALQASWARQEDFLHSLGLSKSVLEARRSGAFLANVFCYPHAPVDALIQGLQHFERPTILLIPQGVAPGLSNVDTLCDGVRLVRIPFVNQADFDRLLWCADLNFVRGEDSFVRAAWAGRPLVWQIYPQEEDAHLDKLEAWLARYRAPAAAHALIRAWNQKEPEPVAKKLQEALSATLWSAWQGSAWEWNREQTERPDLAQNLVDFCTKQAKKR